jgi:Domain of unknown function (DUF5348)
MDINYIKALDHIERLKNELEKIISKSDVKGMENSETYNSIQSLTLELEKAAADIKYFNTPAKEGNLQQQSDGKYEICGITLICGSVLEVWDEEESQWKVGRVEHAFRDDKGYYFYNSDMGHPALYSGMKARIRE